MADFGSIFTSVWSQSKPNRTIMEMDERACDLQRIILEVEWEDTFRPVGVQAGDSSTFFV